jgi:hypothetical protein
MKFMITMTDIEGSWDGLGPEAQQRILEQHARYRTALEEAGCFVDALHLHPRTEAKTVRMLEDGSTEVADGPYHTSPEYMGGCYVIETASQEEAIEWARRGRFMVGANEVRQIWE